MRILLDTNVIADKEFMSQLDIYRKRLEISISSITYTELFIKAYRKGKHEEMRTIIESLDIEVYPYDRNSADICALETHTYPDFSEKARDYMIGASARTHGCKIVTHNVRDFDWMSEDVVEPQELLMELKK